MDKKVEKLDAAVSWARDQHRAALERKRAAGAPRNPFRAKPGQEKEFAAAARAAEAAETALKELTRKREILARAEKAGPAERGLGHILADYGATLMLGAASLGLGGLAADTIVRIGARLSVSPWAVVGALAALALAETVWSRKKR